MVQERIRLDGGVRHAQRRRRVVGEACGRAFQFGDDGLARGRQADACAALGPPTVGHAGAWGD